MVEKTINFGFIENYLFLVSIFIFFVLIIGSGMLAVNYIESYKPVISQVWGNTEVYSFEYEPEASRTTSNILVPDSLFDISFVLDDSLIEDASELTSITTFESFGKVPTTVFLVFIILDEYGKSIYMENFSIDVETEDVLFWDYEGVDELSDGKYVALLETVYDVNIRDEFSQDFEVKSEFSFSEEVVNWFKLIDKRKWGIVFFIIFIILFSWWLISKFYYNKLSL